MLQITLAFSRCNGCKTWRLFECSLAVGDPSMYDFLLTTYLYSRQAFDDSSSLNTMALFSTFPSPKILYLGNVFGKRINTEKAGGSSVGILEGNQGANLSTTDTSWELIV